MVNSSELHRANVHDIPVSSSHLKSALPSAIASWQDRSTSPLP
jgi:hypothetical protein